MYKFFVNKNEYFPDTEFHDSDSHHTDLIAYGDKKMQHCFFTNSAKIGKHPLFLSSLKLVKYLVWA